MRRGRRGLGVRAPAGEAGVVEPPPSFGAPIEAGEPDAPTVDAALDCDANPAACLPPSLCGDGKPGLGESCDDGNTVSGDGCSASCQIEGPYWACAFGAKCIDVRDCAAIADAGGDGGCVVPVKHPAVTDCAPGCKAPSSCGDGVVDFPYEQCDRGAANTNGGAYDSCTTECVLGPRCGDGVKNGPEQCDDGNRVNGDGCSAACLVEGGGPK